MRRTTAGRAHGLVRRALAAALGGLVSAACGQDLVDEQEVAHSAVTNARGQFRLEPVLSYEDYRWTAEKPGYVTRSGRFHLPDPTGSVEPVPYSAPALSPLDFRLVQEPLRDPSGG
jgi:hypothetical protein